MKSDKTSEDNLHNTGEMNEENLITGDADEQATHNVAPVNGSARGKRMKRKPKEIDLLRDENAGLKDKHLRLQAEFDNYRKRMMKERVDLMKTAGEDVLVKLLPILDDFDRAKKHIETAESLDGLKEGVELIMNKFREFMKQNGIHEIEAQGKQFDTDVHEAISQFPVTEEQNKGIVIDVAEKGYTLHDKVIRFSKVIVGV